MHAKGLCWTVRFVSPTDTVVRQTFTHVLFRSEPGVLRVTCALKGYAAPLTLREYSLLLLGCGHNLKL